MVINYSGQVQIIFEQLRAGPKRFRELAVDTGLDDDSLARNLSRILADGAGQINLQATDDTNIDGLLIYAKQLSEAIKTHERYGSILDDNTRTLSRSRLWKAFIDDTERDAVPDRYGFRTHFVTVERSVGHSLN